MKTIYLAGGCFWGMQKFLGQFDGVLSTEVGYANGPDKTLSQQRHSGGTAQHGRGRHAGQGHNTALPGF